eukprot:TRINITY_DN29598_c0_g1_i1.p1 TRINITY_DN29598_c0_g1~~TRINITY_DN29598_c0_g1_i1.p1  ORF type:complete len:661 (+),score=104.59 TRINITY_DN29598_c0_g1_i1:178-2160(+)
MRQEYTCEKMWTMLRRTLMMLTALAAVHASARCGDCCASGCADFCSPKSLRCYTTMAKDYYINCNLPPVPEPTGFYSSGGSKTIHFEISQPIVSVGLIEQIWPGMKASFNEGTGEATASSVSAYTRELLTGPSPFGGSRGTVKIPAGGPGTSDQLKWGEYVAYTRRQVCYIAANIVAGSTACDYDSGLTKLIPPNKCQSSIHKSGFNRALIGLLAACSVDPTMAGGAQGPLLVVAKSTAELDKAPDFSSEAARRTSMRDAELRTCRFRDAVGSQHDTLPGLNKTPSSACHVETSTDFMRETNSMQGQVVVDITAAWIGGYILAAGGCGDFNGGQDERLMTFMPEVMVLSFFMSQTASPVDSAGVSLLIPAYIIGARKVFAGLDGTSRDAGPDFNAGRPHINAAMPMTSDLVSVQVNGVTRNISGMSPFLGFQSINQNSGLGKDVPPARLNRNPLQVLTTGEYSFANQIKAFYNAVSLSSWHPDVRGMLETMVVSIGTGPWGSGVWWGNSQLFFIVMWMGHALAAQTWGKNLPLDYYIYSSFTENPSNQCLVHSREDCESCLRACDNAGNPFPGPDQRYCCMEPGKPWIPSPGLFAGKACIPPSYAGSVCGANGLAQFVERYRGVTVAELWLEVERSIHDMDLATSTIFDKMLLQPSTTLI